MVDIRALDRKRFIRTSQPWWRLLFFYLSRPENMRANPLLRRAMQRQAHLPQWRPQIGSLWFFPIAAVGAILLAVASMGQRGGVSSAVGIAFAAGICVYPPYLLGGSVALLLPGRVGPALSGEVEARTLDLLRLTNLTTSEIVLGKLLGVLVRYEGLLSYVATFFVLILILGGFGAGAVPVALGLPPDATLSAIVLIELPLIFGPIVNIVFISALSLAVSAYTSRPDTSIAVSYGVILAYWLLTGMLLTGILLLVGERLLVSSMLVRGYTTSPIAFVYPNVLRLILSMALSPVLLHLSIRRIDRLGAE